MPTKPLEHLATKAEKPWTDRDHSSGEDGDPRDPFERDRDRIVHSESFRRLQHKTQVLIVTESDLFSTRVLHSIETAQIGRSIAQVLGLNDCLAEAICLGHDVGHTPFGHVGERTIKSLLAGVDVWDSNAHSLRVLEELEQQYPKYDGLDLTWATREGIARHMTVFDIPAAEHGDDRYGQYRAPSLECQVGNVADEIAYLTHDVHDALQYHIVSPKDLDRLGLSLWKKNWTIANAEWEQKYPEGREGVDKSAVLYRRVHGLMIADMVADVIEQSADASGVADLAAARALAVPLVRFSEKMETEKGQLVTFMMGHVYHSPLVERQNAKAARILDSLFKELATNSKLLPVYVQEKVKNGGGGVDRTKKEVAIYLASLTDRGAIDLYDELFTADDRAMGHHVL